MAASIASASASVPVPSAGGDEKKKTARRHFTSYTSQFRAILNKTFPKFGLMKDARMALDGLANSLQKRLGKLACHDLLTDLQPGKPKKTMQVKEVESAIRILLPPKMAEEVVAKGRECVAYYVAHRPVTAKAVKTVKAAVEKKPKSAKAPKEPKVKLVKGRTGAVKKVVVKGA